MSILTSSTAPRDIFNFYKRVAKEDIIEDAKYASILRVAVIPQMLLSNIFTEATKIVRNEDIVLTLHEDITIVGDLHGHLPDLLRILRNNGFPPTKNYLFLGDIIDRGEFSTETLTLITVMKVLYPKNVFIIRGNHEFEEITECAGFLYEFRDLYNFNETLVQQVLRFFSFLPLAAVINDTNFCVHGGLGPNFTRIDDLRSLKRPIKNTDSPILQDALWSDPSDTEGYQPSIRGCGYHFGSDICHDFLRRNGMELIIRGHECVQEGIKYSFDQSLVTVFSASNYCNTIRNKCGLLTLYRHENKRFITTYNPMPYMPRPRASFMKSESETAFIVKLAKLKGSYVTRSTESIPSFRALMADPLDTIASPLTKSIETTYQVHEPEPKVSLEPKPRKVYFQSSSTFSSTPRIASPRRRMKKYLRNSYG